MIFVRIISFFLCFFIFKDVCSQSFKAYSPKDNAVTEDVNPHFYWNEVSNATEYALEISDTPTFSDILFSETTAQLDFFLQDGLEFGDYYWRVRTVIDDTDIITPTYLLSVFTPNNIENTELWIRADTNVVLDQDSKVSEWKDLSSNQYVLSQGSSGKRPTVSNSSFSDLPSMIFDGGDVLEGGNILNFGLSSWTIYTVGNHTTTSTGNFFAKAVAAGSPSRYALNFRSNNDLRFFYIDNNTDRSVQLNTFSNSSNFHLIRSVVNRGNNQINLLVNNSQENMSSISSNHDFTSSFRFLVGAYNNSDDSGEINFLNGSISELIFLNSINQVEQQKMANYLKYRYGTILNLGPDHIDEYGFCGEEILDAGNNHYNYLWSTGETTNSITVDETGVYWVEAEDALGFKWTDSVYIEFQAPNIPMSKVFCPDESKIWNTNLGEHYDYLWSTGETTESIEIDTPDDYWVEITDTNGCVFESDTLTFEEDTFADDVSLGADRDLCTGNILSLEVGAESAATYLWSNGSTDSSIEIEDSGIYWVELENFNGCEGYAEVDINVIGQSPEMATNIEDFYCLSTPFEFEDLSTTSDGTIINYWEWDFGDGGQAFEESGEYTYTATGDFQVELYVETDAGCFGEISKSVEVIGIPDINFTKSDDCQDLPITFNASQLSPTVIETWEWHFDDPDNEDGDEAEGQTASHVYDSPGTYDVSLTATDINGCSNTRTNTINIANAPQVNFDFNEVCEGGIVDFENLTTIENPNSISSNTWSFGDGTSSAQTNPSKIYLFAGNYTVRLRSRADNGCENVLEKNLKIHSLPQVDRVIENQCLLVPVTFRDQSFISNGSVAQVHWNFGDGNSAEGFEVENIFTEEKNYEITQRVVSAFGCEQTSVFNLLVDQELKADFKISPLSIIADFDTEFISTSLGASFFSWQISNLLTSEDEQTTYNFPESFIGETVDVKLSVGNDIGCNDEVVKSFEVLRNETDLAINQLFIQEQDGFYTVGVQLENKGNTPITQADMFLQTTTTPLVKETWKGELLAGERKNYIFNLSPKIIPSNTESFSSAFLCVEAQLISKFGFKDQDLSNNEICENIYKEEPILIHPYPNPVSDQLTLRYILASDERAEIEIFNAYGQIVFQRFRESKKGLNEIPVNVSLWATGVYTVRIHTPTGARHVKFLVKK